MFEEEIEYLGPKCFKKVLYPNTTAFCMLLITLSANLFCPSSAVPLHPARH